MVKRPFIIPKSTTLLLLIITTLTSRCQGLLGGHASGNNGPGNGQQGSGFSNVCTDVKSGLLEFYGYVYGIYDAPEQFLLQNTKNGKCLRVNAGSTKNFADVGFITCDSTDPTQVLQTTKGDLGSHIMTSDSKCLTLDFSSVEQGKLVYQLADMSMPNQQWSFNYTSVWERPGSSEVFQLASSGNCLTCDADITATTCDGRSSQLWEKIPSTIKVKLVGQLKNKKANKCVHSVSGSTVGDFADVDLRSCSGDGDVKLDMGADSLGQQTITLLDTGKLLSVFGTEVADGALVKQMTKLFYGNQLWQVAKLVNGWLQIRNIGSSEYCLSAETNGTYLEMTECANVMQASDIDNSPLQFWKFEPNK